jgi:hypothetical protein
MSSDMSTDSNSIDSINTEHSIVSSIEYSIDRIHILSYPTKN